MENTYVVIGIIAFVVIAIIVMYNSLVRLKNRVEEAWSDIDVQLKRRYDLIPNLINTVKGYASHERETLEKVTQMRNDAMKGQDVDMKTRAETENALSSTLKSIFALSENYPDLKANQNFVELQNELSDTENKIQAARRFYNTNVMEYNTKIESIPTNAIAKMMSYKEKELFELEDVKERENVKVKF